MNGTRYPDRDCVLRAFAGALLGALPLLYTMEMWSYGRTLSDGWILALYVPTVGVVLLCLLFGGFRLGVSGHLGLDLLITQSARDVQIQVEPEGDGEEVRRTIIDFLAGGETSRIYVAVPGPVWDATAGRNGGREVRVLVVGFKES